MFALRRVLVKPRRVYVPGVALDKRGGAGGEVEKGPVLRKGGGRERSDAARVGA